MQEPIAQGRKPKVTHEDNKSLILGETTAAAIDLRNRRVGTEFSELRRQHDILSTEHSGKHIT